MVNSLDLQQAPAVLGGNYHFRNQRRDAFLPPPTMSAQRALFCADIVSEIAEAINLDSTCTPQQRRQCLASMARVSRSFSDPSLRALWADMNTLEPLFKILPGVVDTVENVGGLALNGRDTYRYVSTLPIYARSCESGRTCGACLARDTLNRFPVMPSKMSSFVDCVRGS